MPASLPVSTVNASLHVAKAIQLEIIHIDKSMDGMVGLGREVGEGLGDVGIILCLRKLSEC